MRWKSSGILFPTTLNMMSWVLAGLIMSSSDWQKSSVVLLLLQCCCDCLLLLCLSWIYLLIIGLRFITNGRSGAMQLAAAVTLMPLLIFLQQWLINKCFTMGRIGRAEKLQKLLLSLGRSGSNLIHGLLGPPKTLTQMTSWFNQMFLQVKWPWPTDRQTHRQTMVLHL